MSGPPMCELCGEPADLQCSACLGVSYCSVQHQREDWSRHEQTKCRIVEIRSSPCLGRHLVASRDIEEGEVMLMESPFVVGPRHFIPKVCCVGCCRRVPQEHPKTCRRCKWPICSNACSGLRGPGPGSHEDECNILKTVLKACAHCPDGYVMPLRCVLLQTQNPDKWRWLEEQFTFAERGKQGFDKDRLLPILETLLSPLPRGLPHLAFDCSPATLRRLLNVLDLYALDGSTSSVAPFSGLYAVASLMPHSCAANTRLFFEDAPPPDLSGGASKFVPGRVTVKAARNIKQGEMVTRNSGFAFFPSLARFGSQKVRRNFRCSCIRCQDPHENGSDLGTLRCQECGGAVVPILPRKIEHSFWRCEGPCHLAMSSEIASQVVFSLSSHVSHAITEGADASKFEEILLFLEAYLHPNHVLCFSVKCRLLKMYGQDGDGDLGALDDALLERKAVLGRQVTTIMRAVGVSQIHQEVVNYAQCHLEYAKAQAEIMRRRYMAGVWNSNHVMRAVSGCAVILGRILNAVAVNPRDPLSSQYMIAVRVRPEMSALFAWLMQNGMEVPDKLKSLILL